MEVAQPPRDIMFEGTQGIIIPSLIICSVSVTCFALAILSGCHLVAIPAAAWPGFVSVGLIGCCLSSCLSLRLGLSVVHQARDLVEETIQQEAALPRLVIPDNGYQGICWSRFCAISVDTEELPQIPDSELGSLSDLMRQDPEPDTQMRGHVSRGEFVRDRIRELQSRQVGVGLLLGGRTQRDIRALNTQSIRFLRGLVPLLQNRSAEARGLFFQGLVDAMRDCDPTVNAYLIQEVRRSRRAMPAGQDELFPLTRTVGDLVAGYKSQSAQQASNDDWHGIGFYARRLPELGLPPPDLADPYWMPRGEIPTREEMLNHFCNRCSGVDLVIYCQTQLASGLVPIPDEQGHYVFSSALHQWNYLDDEGMIWPQYVDRQTNIPTQLGVAVVLHRLGLVTEAVVDHFQAAI